MKLRKCAQSAATFLDIGVDLWLDRGGLRILLMGGQASKGQMGWVPIPPILGNPAHTKVTPPPNKKICPNFKCHNIFEMDIIYI